MLSSFVLVFYQEMASFMDSLAPSAVSCVSFATLPVEIFAIVANLVDLKDIKSLRLTARDLLSRSSPYLFRTVTFAPHQEDLDRLDKIAQDGLLSFHTHTLRFDTTVMRIPGVPDDLDEIE